jgi:hypothetical protein
MIIMIIMIIIISSSISSVLLLFLGLPTPPALPTHAPLLVALRAQHFPQREVEHVRHGVVGGHAAALLVVNGARHLRADCERALLQAFSHSFKSGRRMKVQKKSTNTNTNENVTAS